MEVDTAIGLLSLKTNRTRNDGNETKTKHVIKGTALEYLQHEMKQNLSFRSKRIVGKPVFFMQYKETHKFEYDVLKYKMPKTFVDYNKWEQVSSKKNSPNKASEDICIQSISLGYKLSYTEVYGRLLGVDKLVTNRRYKELNDSLINAAIKILSFHCVKNATNDMKYPQVYIATTYLHRYFERKPIDLKHAMLCFYQISRGENRQDNPQFFFTNKIFLIPWNYDNVHWVLLFVDMQDKEVMVLDSCISNTLSTATKYKMNLIVKFLCTLSNYEHKDDTEWLNLAIDEFRWVEENDWVPKQENSYDCGVFMLMNIFVTLHEMGVLYTQQDTNMFRKYLFHIMCDMMHNDEEDMKQYETQIIQSSQYIEYENNEDPKNDDDKNFSKSNDHETKSINNEENQIVDAVKEQNVQLLLTDEQNDRHNSLDTEDDFGLPDVEGKFSEFGIKNVRRHKLRKKPIDGEDYNVENLKQELATLSLHKQSKYIMAVKEKGKWTYYLAIDKTKHPKRKSGRGVLFNVLRDEFVETRFYKSRVLIEFIRTLQKNKGKWMDMSTQFKNIYDMALAEDRHTIIRKHGTYQRLRIVHESNGKREKIYGIVMMDNKEILADELTYKELRRRHLNNEMEALRKTTQNNSWIALSHGESSKPVHVNYDKGWPNIAFAQGKYNSCLQRSIASVLIYIRTARKLETEYINKVIEGLNNLSINIEAKISKGKISEVCVYMRNKGFFIQKYEPKKRKHNGRVESINVLAKDFDFGLFSLIQICGNDYDSNHTIMVCDKWLFDSNHPKAMPLSLKYLNICCSTDMRSVLYESCTLMYKFENKKIQKNRLKIK